MAGDVNEQVFSEKQLFASDVVEEDEGESPVSGASRSPLKRAGPAASPTGTGSTPSGLPSNASKGSSAGQSSIASTAAQSLDLAAKRKKKAAERATKIVYWLETKYDILQEVCASLENWKEAPSATYDFDLLWCDQAIPADRFMKLKGYQKMNHFVGMSAITRKNNMGRNLLRMLKQFPKDYKFFPETWILPTDLSDFKLQFAGKSKTFIIKPDNGCQGKGIFLIRDVEKVPVDFSTTYVAQRYIHKPFLLDGLKFDLRLYVLVAGCDPLRIFIHRRGLVRLASEPYVEPSGKNITQSMVHLTNYAINKMNPNFEENTNPDDAQDGHKRSWEAVQQFLRNEGYDVDTMLGDIEDLIIKTLVAVQPSLSHFYRSCQPEDLENNMCFEILGFDVILDQKLQPWLLEVNHAPSFATESELDTIVKEEVLRDTFNLLDLSPEARRQKKKEAKAKMEQRVLGLGKKTTSADERLSIEQEIARMRTAWEDENLGGYKRLYPSPEKERQYLQFHEAAINIWEMLMGGTSRRVVRLIEDDAQPTPAEKVAKKLAQAEKGPGASEGAHKEPKPETVKRTAGQLREVMERLTAGCSAFPRQGQSTSRRRGGEKDDEEPNAEAQGQVEDEQEPQSRPHRGEVQVGDIIKVQTNLGWEAVTVRSKRSNGKIDIQFKDGEYMRSVMPRVLRDSNGMPIVLETADSAVSAAQLAGSSATRSRASTKPPAPAALSAAGPRAASMPPGQGLRVDARADEAGGSELPAASLPSSVEEALACLDATLSSQLRGRRGTGQSGAGRGGLPLWMPVSNELLPMAAPGQSRGIPRGPGPGTGVPGAVPDGNRAQEVRLRSHLQHLINVRPIIARRGASSGRLGESDSSPVKVGVPPSPRQGSRRHP